MTNPLPAFGDRAEPGESEMSWGKGMMPPLERAAVADFFPSNYDRLVAIRQTDPANPLANEEATFLKNPKHSGLTKNLQYDPGDMKPGALDRVRESGPASSSGQHAPLDVSTYTPGHSADGQQDGSGDSWRASFPTEASRYHGPNEPGRQDL